MKNDSEALIMKSFDIIGRGIIAEIQHNRQGLPPGTELQSRINGRIWKIKNRLVFNHTYDEHRLFDNEEIEYSHFAFRSFENLGKSGTDILNKEAEGIYQYSLDSEGHADKPEEGEILKING
jgi:hypothetical protein